MKSLEDQGQSKIFFSDQFQEIEKNTYSVFESQNKLLTLDTSNSTRAAGDAIQKVITNYFDLIINKNLKSFQVDKSRKSLADIFFEDNDEIKYFVDVKSHRLDTEFNMPNLTSVKRIIELYKDPKKYFSLLMVDYEIQVTNILVKKVIFAPIEHLSWDCLTIGNLGWGQIQIKNSNNIILNRNYNRRLWLQDLANKMLDFYPREIKKIQRRIDFFKKVKDETSENLF